MTRTAEETAFLKFRQRHTLSLPHEVRSLLAFALVLIGAPRKSC